MVKKVFCQITPGLGSGDRLWDLPECQLLWKCSQMLSTCCSRVSPCNHGRHTQGVEEEHPCECHMFPYNPDLFLNALFKTKHIIHTCMYNIYNTYIMSSITFISIQIHMYRKNVAKFQASLYQLLIADLQPGLFFQLFWDVDFQRTNP